MAAFEVVIHCVWPGVDEFGSNDYEIEARDHKEAIIAAKRRWAETVQREWPDYEIEDAFVIPDGTDPNECELEEMLR